MGRIHLTERQWAFISPLLPPPARTGRPRADDRRTIEGILYMLITGCRWQDLPSEYGAPTTVWRRLRRWGEAGVWEHIWRAALEQLDRVGQLDWSIAFLDGSFVPAKNGGVGVGLTRKGKGTKWMLVVDGHGLHWGSIWPEPIRRRCAWPSRRWRAFGCEAHVDGPSSAPRNWSPIAAMIAQHSGEPCGGVG